MTTIKVEDMNCNHCAQTIEKALKQHGVHQYSINLENKQIIVNEKEVLVAKKAIEDSGYTPQ